MLLQEAQKRDHRKLARNFNCSLFIRRVGFPFWHPAGMVLYNIVCDYSRRAYPCCISGSKTPIILNEELWKRRAIIDKYRDAMYFTEIDESKHAVKPMNCPGHLLIFKNSAHSYCEFPISSLNLGWCTAMKIQYFAWIIQSASIYPG